jgi:hypothetical protein
LEIADERSLLGDVARYLAQTYAPVHEIEDDEDENEEDEEVEETVEVEISDSDDDEDVNDRNEFGNEHENEDDQNGSENEEEAWVEAEAEAEDAQGEEEVKEDEEEEDDDDEDKTLVDASEDEDSSEWESESESEGDILETFLNIFKNPPPRLLELQQTENGREHLTLANALKLVNALGKPNPEVILLSRLFELEQIQFDRAGAEPEVDSDATAAIRTWFSLAGIEESGRLCAAVEQMTGGVSPTVEQKERFESYLDGSFL